MFFMLSDFTNEIYSSWTQYRVVGIQNIALASYIDCHIKYGPY